MSDTGILFVTGDCRLPVEAGGKARGMRLLARAGLRSPPTWIVLPSAPESSILDLAERLRATGHTLFAIRSSAREEDDETASFAGIHESRIGVPIDGIRQAVAEVAASTVSERSRAYRAYLGLPIPGCPGAVLVQALVASTCAGVAFGAGEHLDRIVIEAVEGFGETAVGGEARERHVLLGSHGVWRLKRSIPRLQPRALLLEEGRVIAVPLADDRRRAPVLDGPRARAIASVVDQLQRLEGGPLDVEWAFSGDELWFLQARARTRPLAEGLPSGESWSRANVRDVLPEIPSALTRSLIEAPIDAGTRDHLAEYGVRVPPEIPLFGFVHGRPVFSERTMTVSDMLGVSRAAMQAEFGGASEPADQVLPMDLRRALRHPVVLLRASRLPRGAERQARSFLSYTVDLRRSVESVRVADAADSALLELALASLQELSRRFAQTAMRVVAALTNAQYPALWRLRRHPSPRALMARLMAGGESSVSTRQVDDLVELAEILRGWPGATAFLTSIIGQDVASPLWPAPTPKSIRQALEAWLQRYGHRGPYESDLASPRYVDDLRLLARLLLPLVESEDALPIRDPVSRREEAHRAWQEVEAAVGARGRRRMQRDIERMKRFTSLREEIRSQTIGAMLPQRRIIQELGARLARRGSLRSPDDVWHLSMDELSRAVSSPEFPAEYSVAREQARRAVWQRIEVPNRFTTEDIPNMGLDLATRPESLVFVGNGISSGTAEGPARILSTPDEGERLGTGEVLVAPATDPGWTPLFTRAAAVIVEIGGALSHAGIVAREFGVPCVANIDGVTRLLQDGDIVRVEGASGRVTVVSRAPFQNAIHQSKIGGPP